MSDSDATRPPANPRRKIAVDDRGRSVWNDTIETLELELVSTQQLKALLASDNVQQRELIQQAASHQDDGYLVRDNTTGHFSIIDDISLQAILNQQDANPKIPPRPADATLQSTRKSDDDEELSLVSTQRLRKILRNEPPAPETPTVDERYDRGGGFDPYNKG